MGKPQQTPEQEFDAGDETQVAERKTKSKRLEDARADGLRYVMSSARGRAWMRHLIAQKLFTRVGKQRPAAIFTGNSTTFYNAALKELGDVISAEIATITPADFRLMEQEGDIDG